MSEAEESNQVKLSHHPLFVLFVGAILSTLLSVVLVPIYQKYSIKLERKEDARRTFEHEIHALDGKVNTSLNSMLTNFEFFCKRDLHTTSAEIKTGYQLRLFAAYERFDEIAWWKLDSVISEYAGTVDLDQRSTERLLELSAEYTKLLVERTQLFEPAWGLFNDSPEPRVTLKDLVVLREKQQESSQRGRAIIQRMTSTLHRN